MCYLKMQNLLKQEINIIFAYLRELQNILLVYI